MTETDFSKRITELGAKIVDLAHAVATLTSTVTNLDVRLKLTRRTIWIISLAFALDLALTGVMTVTIFNQVDVTHKLATVQAQGLAIRQGALCPLYKFIISQETPAARAALPPAQQSEFDQEAAILANGYAAIGCMS